MSSLDTKIAQAQSILPAWFVGRMMSAESTYGLMMSHGHVVAITRINEVRTAHDGTIWLDVLLAPQDDYWDGLYDPAIFGAPTARRDASINAAHISAAFELTNPGQKQQHTP